ncbi:zinc finger protein Elbow isoform X2 [Eupeodes corollae]|uniref:zinc finger protein Elbow isoform X2 n=1 Tax=Eupeodes corollae TaxID=290404 RepID=UPI0024905B11|nr:zinc finger protein Elbow isoform X2 [Eupeodes corollae]
MLTSSNQYLRPDYLTPTTLDTKNSPLALLAQTCSAIGADTPNPKLLANIEKSTKSSHKSADCRDKTSPVGSQSSSVSTGSTEHQQVKSSFKPYESNNNRYDLLDNGSSSAGAGNQSSVRVKTPKSNTATQRCDSNQSATSQRDSPAMIATPGTAATTNTAARKTPSTLSSASSTGSSAASIHQNPDQPNPSPHRASSKESFGGGNNNISVSPAQSSPVSKSVSEAQYMKALHAASMQPQVSTAGQAYYSGYPPGLGYPMDLMTASALMSPHHPMFKAAAMSPYLNYARLKGIDPSAMMTPVCRDPYCTGCPSSPHFLNKAAGQPCPAGCPHCESPSGPKSAAAAAYVHAQLAALTAASQLPYVCSWIAGDAAYCGKRFGTSDELFQHLRTHTASMPESMLAAAAAGGFPPNHPLFQRTYPTPPLSPLSATGRYHPYSKPSMLPPSALGPPPSLAGMPMPPHPSLAQYFSPYSLYGNPRLGSSHP